MSRIPALVPPMLAVPGELPGPDEDARWAYEMKWDGVRAVGYVDGGSLRLMSRNDLDISRGYPEVGPLAGAFGDVPAVLDGELVALDSHGRSSFGRLQERMHVKDAATVRRLMASVPVTYMVFDVLDLDGRSLLAAPYTERRAVLEQLDLNGGPGRDTAWRVPPSFTGGGPDVLAASRENGMEGVVAKRLASVYRPGRRSPDWRKIKHIRTQEVVVGGWRAGKGRRANGIGALLLGIPGESGLDFVGGVGTGFTQAMLDDLLRRLRPLHRATPPFAQTLPGSETRDVQWVSPKLVGEVVFSEWTGDGRLRHPSWRGLRPDKSPGDVVRES